GIIGRADIALDTFPYAGQTTTCECLWMGVPVVTVAGSSHVSRVGAGILTRAGLAELCAEGVGEYESIAVDLAGRVADLCRLRKDLRSRLRQSSVVSGSSVRELEGCYRAIWRRWCESKQEERK
ncbi:MAG: hypothetical protein H7039_01570, partial [Bryobacteraceae bacterium]|nr:hypothetical protein [Bryobacteraceae bacterium]